MKKYLLFALPFFVVGCSEEVKSVDWWGSILRKLNKSRQSVRSLALILRTVRMLNKHCLFSLRRMLQSLHSIN
uniref:Lipoprotein n=1 Tax=Escherichia coli TaxID=562 RepID=A0A1U9XFE2_ECOLX|nr:hypothetical protein pGD46-3_00031 [Escherichia coli]